MITKEEIKNLADLARLELRDFEVENLVKEVDSILEYVGQIQEISGEMERNVPRHHNIMRDDVVTNEPRQYTEDILENAPFRDGDYLKVKKILG
jgi:aspartyl-tRNA(Asn)/glutamyl-tRNA(Gln) amidotransferase subunit C